jgi:hypothetical protein
MGRRGEALQALTEAVAIRRHLAKLHPTMYQGHLQAIRAVECRAWTLG